MVGSVVYVVWDGGGCLVYVVWDGGGECGVCSVGWW